MWGSRGRFTVFWPSRLEVLFGPVFGPLREVPRRVKMNPKMDLKTGPKTSQIDTQMMSVI